MHLKTVCLLLALCTISSNVMAQNGHPPALAPKTWVVGLSGNFTQQDHILSSEKQAIFTTGLPDTFKNAINTGVMLNGGIMLNSHFYLGLDAQHTWQSRHPEY